jgi:hypothetical protein
MTEIDPFETVLEAVADGASLVEACRAPGRPSRKTVQRRCRTDAAFAQAYEAACEDRSEIRLQRYADTIAKLERSELDPSSARVILESLRFLMTTDNNRRYGAKTRTELTGKDGRDLTLAAPAKPVDDMETARWVAHLLYKAGGRTGDAGSITALLGTAEKAQP